MGPAVSPCGRETIALHLDHLITFTHRALQAEAVDDCDVTASIMDQSGFLKSMSRDRYSFPAHAEHVGNQFLSHDQLVRCQTVVAQHKPAEQLLRPLRNHSRRPHLC